MWLAALGPLLVHDGEAQIDVPRGRLRVLLAALLLHAGNPVAAEALAEVVWDAAPPPSADVTLRSHVRRLRHVLGPLAGARLLTQHPGYLLQARDDEVDVLRFRGLCQDGGIALRGGAWDRANTLLTEAVGLWRGDPLADVRSDLLLREELPGLQELRLQAEEWRADAALHLGRHDELVARLQALATRHPLRERFHAQLMLALYRCGRQAEALAVYQAARRALIAELGTEPGPELRRLHQRVLSVDPALAAPGAEAASTSARSADAAVPRELPARVRNFAGRSGELLALTRLLDEPGADTRGTVVISAIGGTAGVGKTALAVHWAHQVAGHFPDGQLYVNLRGYDPDRPLPPADALAGFLRALGVPGQEIPVEGGERAARYRSMLADKRMLVILDNAGTDEQVRPLLPGSPSCVVIVTSRDSLAGLVARDGAHRLNLDLLPPDDAIGLLRMLIGERVDADPAGAQALSHYCCRLPLALRVAAELAVARPADTLTQLCDELAGQQRRLDLLDAGGDPRTAVRTVFSWSYDHLNTDAARTFRLMALHPGPDFDTCAVAALTGATTAQVTQALDVLARAHLIQPTGAGSHTMHDLLRDYAAELGCARDTEPERRAALTRLFDHYLRTAATAMDTLFPAERHLRPRVVPPGSPEPSVTDPPAARQWLDSQLANLSAVAVHAANDGWPGWSTRLATTLYRYLNASGHYTEAVTIQTHARQAARQMADPVAEATALVNLGAIETRQYRWQRATDHLESALELCHETGDLHVRARVLSNLALADFFLGRYERAAGHQQQALVLHRGSSDQSGQICALGNLGIIDIRAGRYQRAADNLQQALDLTRQTSDRANEAHALDNLGDLRLRQGHYTQAADYLRQALELYRETGNRSGEAHALTNSGRVCLRQGRQEEAETCHHQALALSREIGERDSEADALIALGEVCLVTSQHARALVCYQDASEIAVEIGDKYQQARALNGIGDARHATGDPAKACAHWQRALDLYTELDCPEAAQLRTRLTASPLAGSRRHHLATRDEAGRVAVSAGVVVTVTGESHAGGGVVLGAGDDEPEYHQNTRDDDKPAHDAPLTDHRYDARPRQTVDGASLEGPGP